MLGSLSKFTFFSTLFFFVGLRIFDFVPLVEIDEKLIPPIKAHKEIIEWSLSFGIIPLLAAFMAWFFSYSFEIHNKIAKFLFVRHLWDKYFIVKVLLNRVKTETKLQNISTKKVMNDLYYPEVKNIDQHYVHLFWRYALIFWVLFEHLFFSLLTTIIIFFVYPEKSITYLGYYLGIILVITFSQLIMVTVQKSKDQAKQISKEKIESYFNPKSNIVI
jgi:hypothetical protein